MLAVHLILPALSSHCIGFDSYLIGVVLLLSLLAVAKSKLLDLHNRNLLGVDQDIRHMSAEKHGGDLGETTDGDEVSPGKNPATLSEEWPAMLIDKEWRAVRVLKPSLVHEPELTG